MKLYHKCMRANQGGKLQGLYLVSDAFSNDFVISGVCRYTTLDSSYFLFPFAADDCAEIWRGGASERFS